MRTIHAPLPSSPSLPLCGRVLSRNATLTARGHYTMLTGASATPPGFAPGQRDVREKPCRHCQRALGLLPPLRGHWSSSVEDIEDEGFEFSDEEDDE